MCQLSPAQLERCHVSYSALCFLRKSCTARFNRHKISPAQRERFMCIYREQPHDEMGTRHRGARVAIGH
eukprot:10686521-Karenia_brevis.AAC.1